MRHRVGGKYEVIASDFASAGRSSRNGRSASVDRAGNSHAFPPPLSPPACVIAGGETTVTIRGNGKGGRNQELALAAAIHLDGWSDIALLSGGTDGTDGPTDAAGAIADGSTLKRGLERTSLHTRTCTRTIPTTTSLI